MSTAETYRRFSALEAHGVSPIYEMLTLNIAEDAQVVALIDRLPPKKRQPNLVLGAARHLGAPTDAYEEFRRWVIDNWTSIERTALTRSTQTNEAGRTAALLPVLGLLREPLTLIEVGASAGLCLYPDRYSYLYDGDVAVHPDGGPSTVMLQCVTTGRPPIPKRAPAIASRVGVDVNPLDVADEDDMGWLESLIWPEHEHRRERLRSAAAIVRDNPPALALGDLDSALPDLVSNAPPATTVVVFHSAVLAYVDPASRAAFERSVRELQCHWVANEGAGVLPEITGRTGIPVAEIGGRFVTSLDGRPVALTGPHGQSIDWID